MSCGSGLPSTAYNPPSIPIPSKENPEGKFSVIINNGDEYTDNQTITLKLYAGADTKRMAISNMADFAGASQIPYQETMEWKLNDEIPNPNDEIPIKSQIPNPKVKTVYAKFYTQYGVASEVVSDSIILKISANDNQAGNADNQNSAENSNNADTSNNANNPETNNSGSINNAKSSQPSLFIFTKTLQFGSQGNEVIQLQDKLKQLNFFPKEIKSNSNFGLTTEKAVKEYQASKGIYSCGIVGPRTRKALNNKNFITNKDYQFTKDLKYNDRNEEVKQLQTRLQNQNFFPRQTKPTGWFGSITQTAVNIFQKFYNLVQSGIIDFQTREVLNR